jgi:hypothetical protein
MNITPFLRLPVFLRLPMQKAPLRGLVTVALLALVPLRSIQCGDALTARKDFRVVAFCYARMPERFDGSLKVYPSLTLGPANHLDHLPDSFSYETTAGRARIFAINCDSTVLLLFVQSLDPKGHDMAVLVTSPEAMTLERMKSLLETIPVCADSAVLSEGHPLLKQGGPDVSILKRDFGDEPLFAPLRSLTDRR